MVNIGTSNISSAISLDETPWKASFEVPCSNQWSSVILFIIKKQGHSLLSQSESVVPPVDICICYGWKSILSIVWSCSRQRSVVWPRTSFFDCENVPNGPFKNFPSSCWSSWCELPKISLISYPFHSLLVHNRSLYIPTPGVWQKSCVALRRSTKCTVINM